MKSMIVFAILFGCAFAAPNGYHHAPALAAVPVVSHAKVGAVAHTPIYNVQKVHQTVHPVSIPVHHPAVTTVHQEPTAVLAQAPKMSGYSYTSEVSHDKQLGAKVIAAPAYAHAEPAYAHAAPVLAHAAPAYAHAAPAYAHAEPAYAHAAPAYAHAAPAYAHDVHHAPAAYVSGSSLSVAPAVIKETPSVSQYTLQTGRIETASQAHYGTVLTPTINKVGYAPVVSKHGY